MTESKRPRRRSRSHEVPDANLRLWPVLVAIAIIFGIGGFFYLRNILGSPATTSGTASPSVTPTADTTSDGLGQAVPIQGAAHIEAGQAHPDYNSDPPTSGWHLAAAIPAGFYEEPQADEALVHNLEHGHIVIAYDCEKLKDCDDVKAKLKAMVDRYDGWKVTVVPRENKDTPLALTAWGRILRLDDYDEAQVTAFIDAYRDQGPEKTPE